MLHFPTFLCDDVDAAAPIMVLLLAVLCCDFCSCCVCWLMVDMLLAACDVASSVTCAQLRQQVDVAAER